MAADWSDLPEDLLFSIAMRTEHLSDYIRFGAVCKSWRSAVIDIPRPPLHLRFPFVYLSRANTRDHALYSPYERKLRQVRLPDRARTERCIGSSSDGWVCMLDDHLDLYLFNLFSNAVVLLPPLWTTLISEPIPIPHDDYVVFRFFRGGIGGIEESVWSGKAMRDEYVGKALWSAEPTDPNCIVVLLCNMVHGGVVYCRPGDERWTVFKTSLDYVLDAIFFNENLYVVDWYYARVAAINLHQGQGQEIMMLADLHSRTWNSSIIKCLVAGPSGLLMIVRHTKNFYETEGFELFKLDDTLKKWVEIESLDEGMVFLGVCNSIWLSSNSLKECKGNSIYFMDNNIYDAITDLRIYHLGDGSIDSIYRHDKKPIYVNHQWVLPIP